MASTPTTPTTYTPEQLEEQLADLRGQVDRLNEILTLYDAGNVPNSPVPPTGSAGAARLFCTNGQPQWIDDTGLLMGMVGAQQSWFPGTTVTGTGLGNLAQWSIPKNNAEVNAVYETEVWGNGVTGSTNATLQFAAVLGGVTMSSVTIGTSFFATANLAFRYHMTVRAINHTIGSGGTWSSLIFGEISAFNVNLIGGGGSQNTAGLVSCESSGTSTVDTTVGENLSLSAAWGAAATGSQAVNGNVAIAKRWC